jgi:hypothetical protein
MFNTLRTANADLRFYVTTVEKARKNLSQGKKNFGQVKKNLSQSTVYILPKTPTHYKTLTNTHITKPIHINTHTHKHEHTTKQYKTTTVQIKFDIFLLHYVVCVRVCVRKGKGYSMTCEGGGKARNLSQPRR